jgi:hypothetical protein
MRKSELKEIVKEVLLQEKYEDDKTRYQRILPEIQSATKDMVVAVNHGDERKIEKCRERLSKLFSDFDHIHSDKSLYW